jgi:fumarate reductase flavoprotein subunit
VTRHDAPLQMSPGSLEGIRESLHDTMWTDVGILRSADSLRRGLQVLDGLDAQLAATGVGGGSDRAFHLGWHDWINLRNLVTTSRVIALSALAREDSRGAHFREDFPATGDLATSSFVVVRQRGESLDLSREPVRFTRVAPGDSLLPGAR